MLMVNPPSLKHNSSNPILAYLSSHSSKKWNPSLPSRDGDKELMAKERNVHLISTAREPSIHHKLVVNIGLVIIRSTYFCIYDPGIRFCGRHEVKPRRVEHHNFLHSWEKSRIVSSGDWLIVHVTEELHATGEEKRRWRHLICIKITLVEWL